jgi:hypothetical protein
MPDPLLSTLCTLCRANPPKYKCPRCAVRTCSLSCVQKHKDQADCSGERNQSAYVPVKQLRTAAGFDHDYNFLHGIELAKARSEKGILEERSLFKERELRPGKEKEGDRFERVWYGDELHHIPIAPTFARREEKDHKALKRQLRELDIQVVSMPKGMGRNKDNKTKFDWKRSTINWQVEWIILRGDGDESAQPDRVLHRALGVLSLCKSLAMSLEWRDAGKRKRAPGGSDMAGDPDEPPRKIRKKQSNKQQAFLQDSIASTWLGAEYTMQSSHTGTWDQQASSASTPWVVDDDAELYSRWRFFLHSSIQASARQLIPISSTESLSDALSGRDVVEFPTIYAVAPGAALPAGFGVESMERRARVERKPVEASRCNPRDEPGVSERQGVKREHRASEEQPDRGERFRSRREGQDRASRWTSQNKKPPGKRPNPRLHGQGKPRRHDDSRNNAPNSSLGTDSREGEEMEQGEEREDREVEDGEVKQAQAQGTKVRVDDPAQSQIDRRPKGLVEYGSSDDSE